MTTRFGRDRLVASGVACFALVLVPAALAQDGRDDPRDVGSSRTAMFDRSDLGNVAQAARFAYGSGERELKRAESLEAKLGKLEGKKLETTQKKIATAYENAQGSFREALGLAPKMVEAYVGLGRVLRATRKYRESLQVVVQRLRLDSANDALFTGWAESILGLDMLGDATQAYAKLVETNPARAELLMMAIKDWLAARQVDPRELAAADVERMAAWIADQEG